MKEKILDILKPNQNSIILFFNTGDYKIYGEEICKHMQNFTKISCIKILESTYINDGNLAFRGIQIEFTLDGKKMDADIDMGADTLYCQGQFYPKNNISFETQLKHQRMLKNAVQK